jgi:hypothetical protein
MSRPIAVAFVVSILNPTVSPGVTLISVANPWIAGSPAPATSHWLAGVPGSPFSQTIGLLVQACALSVISRVSVTVSATPLTVASSAIVRRRMACFLGFVACGTDRKVWREFISALTRAEQWAGAPSNRRKRSTPTGLELMRRVVSERSHSAVGVYEVPDAAAWECGHVFG